MDQDIGRADIRSRHIAAPPEAVWAAIADPQRIARWWGPDGFRNSIHEFDFVPGGLWRLTMHGPDGTDYPNESRFLRIRAGSLFEIEHFSVHHFVLRIELNPEGEGTRVDWHQCFDTVADYERLTAFVAKANAQNLERLATEVARGV